MGQPATKKPATHSSPPFRAAAITWYTPDPPVLPHNCDYLAYCLETCPTSGRKHYQMFAYASRAMRMGGWAKTFRGAHIETMYGTFRENEKYCSKEGQLTELGQLPMHNGSRRDLSRVCERIKRGDRLSEVALDEPEVFVQYHNGLTRLSTFVAQPYQHDTVRGIWIYGPPGTGKSHHARTIYEDIYIKSQTKWFDGYSGQKTILLDDFDCKVMGHYLKIWMDRWACSGEVKGSTVALQHHRFVVTSNYTIAELFPDPALCEAITRRCTIIHKEEVYKPPEN